MKLLRIGVACLAASALISIALAAHAADASTIDFAPLVNQIVVPVLVALLPVLVAWIVMRVRTWLGIKENSQLAACLETAMQNALALAQSRVPGVVAGLPMHTSVKSEVIAAAAKYAMDHVPDTLKQLGVTPEMLKEKLEARLSLNTTPAAESIAVPTEPGTVRSHWLIGLLALVFLLPLGACTTDGAKVDLSTPQAKVDAIDAAYTPVRLVAALCGSGAICSDPNVAANVRLAIPVADAAVAEAKKQILASDGSQSAVAQWSGYAISAVNVLSQALAAYGVKAAPAGG